MGPLGHTTEHSPPTIPDDSTSLSGTYPASLRPSFCNSPGQSHRPIDPSSSQPQCPSLDAEYSSILLLNAQSVNPSAKSLCKWKLPYVSENFLYNIHTNIPILRISESWLKSYKTDAQIHIKDFVPIRSDRSIRKGGDAILYIHEKMQNIQPKTRVFV